jgi:hypothetical protein
MSEEHLIVRQSFDTAELVARRPPRFRHHNNQIVYELACPPDVVHSGTLVLSRWRAMPLPAAIPSVVPAYEVREDIFGYEPNTAADSEIEWYLNFADPRLFIAYSGSLLAQDELQVLEHPSWALSRRS